MKNIKWVACTLALSLVLAVPASAQTYSIVDNGTFDTNLNGWNTKVGSFARTTATVRTGSGAAQMDTTLFDEDWSYAGVVQDCLVVTSIMGTWPEDSGTKYVTLSAWVNTSDDTVDAFMQVHFYTNTVCYSGNGAPEWTFYIAPGVSGPTSGWEQINGTSAIPTGVASMEISLYAQGTTTETIYWDDVDAFSSYSNAVTVQDVAAGPPWPVSAAALAGVGVIGSTVGLLTLQKRKHKA